MTDGLTPEHGIGTMKSQSFLNMQQPIEQFDQTDQASGCSVIHMPELDKTSQLTNAVSNLFPLLESFRQEQILRDQQFKNLTEENGTLIERIRQLENLEHLPSETQNALFVENGNKVKQAETLLQEERAQFQESLLQYEFTQKQLQESNKKLQTELDEKIELLRKNEYAYNNLYHEYTSLASRLGEFEKEKNDHKTLVEKYKTKLLSTFEENKRLKEENEKLIIQRDKYSEDKQNLEKEKRKLEDELKETKKRLSQVMGNKLSADNPDIADLSDQNRPTKLAERYLELYDNEWTDAFEVIEENSGEKEAIKTLLQLLQGTRRFCSDMAKDQVENIRTAVTMTFSQDNSRANISVHSLETSEEKPRWKRYMEILQRNDSTTFNLVNQKKVKPFVSKCLELCWLMAVQSPPVVFSELTEQGSQERFDINKYKPYTQTGAFLDFVVWPPLYLHKKGGLLVKGVAQACGVSSSKARKTKAGSQAAGFQDTAEHVPSSTDNEMSRSFNVKSSKNKKTDFSKTVHGASGIFNNNF